MFIDEDEYERRMRTEANLLNRIEGAEPRKGEIVPPIPGDISIDDLLNPEPPKEISEKKLHKLLNPVPGYAGKGPRGLHRDTQAAIGIAAGILGTTKASRMNGVSITEAHTYERGYTSPNELSDPAKSPKQDLQDKIIQGHGIIVDKCFDRLMTTLDLLDDDKLGGVRKATELSVIAKNLSGIIASATVATKDQVDVQEKSVHFHIMRPEIGQASDYPIVEVSSEKTEIEWSEKLNGQ